MRRTPNGSISEILYKQKTVFFFLAPQPNLKIMWQKTILKKQLHRIKDMWVTFVKIGNDEINSKNKL